MPKRRVNETDRFKGPGKYAAYLIARALVAALQCLPVGFAWRLGRGVGWLVWRLLKRRRQTVQRNIGIVNEWLKGQPLESRAAAQLALPLEEQVREVFQRAGANLLGGFGFVRMRPDRLARHMRIDGVEHLSAALAQGKGVIILLAHMGPWEALNQLTGLVRAQGIEATLGAMYRPLNNSYLDDWVKAQRGISGTQLFSRRDGFHKPVDFLRGGGMLGILADQKMREGPSVPYFGELTPTSPVPGLFQRRTGAPILTLSVVTTGPAQWQLSIHPVEWPEIIAPKDRETPARYCNAALERVLGRSPLDGFWLHKRF